MKLAVVLGALALVGGCKKKEATAPAAGSAGSGSAVATAPPDATTALPEPAGAPAVLEKEDVNADNDPELAAAFGKQMPKLPALNADGTLIATLDDVSGGPMIPPAMQVSIAKFPSDEHSPQELPILTIEEATHANEAGDEWLTPELKKTLAARGKTITEKLAGFHSLHEVKLDDGDDYSVKPMKIGDVTFSAEPVDLSLVLTLSTAQGKLIHRAVMGGYTEREKGRSIDDACNYTPVLRAIYTDPPKPRALYLEIGYRYRDDCSAPTVDYIVWSTDPNSTTPEEKIAELVGDQLDIVGQNETESPFAEDATIVSNGAMTATTKDVKLIGVVDHVMDYTSSTMSDVDITKSRDGKTFWASANASVSVTATNSPGKDASWRVSDLFVQTPKGWQIVGAAWTSPTENAKANKDAQAGKIKAEKLEGDAGDASLNAAFAKLTTEGALNVDKNLIAFGSGPGERTEGAAAFVKPWNAAWKGKTTIVSSIARLAPSGTTGWVAATVELQKKGYKIPFTVFAVFDKDASGAWTLVHIHFAV